MVVGRDAVAARRRYVVGEQRRVVRERRRPVDPGADEPDQRRGVPGDRPSPVLRRTTPTRTSRTWASTPAGSNPTNRPCPEEDDGMPCLTLKLGLGAAGVAMVGCGVAAVPAAPTVILEVAVWTAFAGACAAFIVAGFALADCLEDAGKRQDAETLRREMNELQRQATRAGAAGRQVEARRRLSRPRPLRSPERSPGRIRRHRRPGRSRSGAGDGPSRGRRTGGRPATTHPGDGRGQEQEADDQGVDAGAVDEPGHGGSGKGQRSQADARPVRLRRRPLISLVISGRPARAAIGHETATVPGVDLRRSDAALRRVPQGEAGHLGDVGHRGAASDPPVNDRPNEPIRCTTS